MKLPRAAKITYTIHGGADILTEGHDLCRKLWNHTIYCLVGMNRQLSYQRVGKIALVKNGELVKSKKDGSTVYVLDWETAVRNYPHNRGEKYLGKFSMQKELKDYFAAKNLSDRAWTNVIKTLDVAMRSWFSNLKSNPKARPPKYCHVPRPLFFEVGRNAKRLEDGSYRLTVLGGHIKKRHAYITVHARPDVDVESIKTVTLNPDKSGNIVYYINQKPCPGERTAGIDLGIVQLAAVAFDNGESILYSGRGLLAANRWTQKQAAKCKPGGWRGNGHQASKMSGHAKKLRNFEGDTRAIAVHNLTFDIIQECIDRGVGTVIIGNLTGIRKGKDFGRYNQKLHSWAFAEMRRQLEYKAEEYSIKVIPVPEKYTSQTCHFCETRRKSNRKSRGNYVCNNCGRTIQADVNGAFNIMNKKVDEPATARGNLHISPTEVGRFDQDWSIKRSRC